MKPLIIKSPQSGRTLIELMIAIAISVFIIIGISVIFSSSTQSSRAANQIGALSEDGPLAIHLMGQSIKRAGYGEIIGTNLWAYDQTLFAFPHLRACRSGNFNNAGAGDFNCVAGGAGAPDSIALQFQSDAITASSQRDSTNCVGGAAVMTTINEVSHPAYLTQVPVISNVYTLNSGNVRCSGNGSTPQAMASNIQELKIYYGYDEQAAASVLTGQATVSPSAAKIVDADMLIASDVAFAGTQYTAWDFVISAHVCAVAATKDKGTSVQTNVSYEGCPDNVAEAILGTGPTRTATDGAVRRTYRQVFTVRSRATGSPAVRQKVVIP